MVTENDGPLHILKNKTETGNHWIGVHLVGHKSNRDGIGAVIKIVISAGPQWQTVTTSASYLSSSDPRAHFGLGQDSVVKTIEVRWPSGIVQTLNNDAGARYLMIDELTGNAKRWQKFGRRTRK